MKPRTTTKNKNKKKLRGREETRKGGMENREGEREMR